MRNFILFLFILAEFLLITWQGTTYAQVKFTLEPRLTLTTEHDDNIYFTASDEESDMVTHISPGINFKAEAPSGTIDMDYEYQHVFYADHSSNDSDRHYVSVDGWKQFSDQWKITLKDDYMRSEDPYKVQQFIGAIKYENLEYDYNEAHASIIYSFGDENHVKLGYHDMFFRNRASNVENTENHYPFLDTVYWITPPWGIHVQLGEELSRFDYSDDFDEFHGGLTLLHKLDLNTRVSLKSSFSDMNFNGSSNDYRIYDVGAGLSKVFSEHLGISLGAGYYLQDVSDDDDEDSASGYLNFWAKYEKYSFKFELSKGYDEIYFDGEDLGFSHYWIVGGMGNYNIIDDLSFSLESYYREDKFPQTEDNIKEQTLYFDCGLTWDVTQWLEASVEYSHLNRDASEEDYEYRDNRITFNITLYKDFNW